MVTSSDFDVGAALDALIARSGKQKNVLAAHMGVSEQAVQKWIKHGTIAREHIRKLCLFLDCSADELLGIRPIGKTESQSHSQAVRLDPEIVEATHAALAEMYERNGRQYPMEDVARFVLVYEKLALRKAGVSEAELFGAGLSETVTPQGATSERASSVPGEGTHKGVVARRIRSKA